jgi:carbonic anhydrase/acetyltransferase-like protein (isoleucine patch superfamily)
VVKVAKRTFEKRTLNDHTMALIKSLLGHTPEFGEECFVAENATIIGQFKCGDGCSFWYGSVVRGDVNSITFGHKVNVQDNATVHCTYEKFPTVVGNNVSIGHNAIVHGCTIEDNVLIGMGAIVMDDCGVGEGCIVAAGSVVTQGKKMAPGTLWAGVPAKEIGPVPERLRKGEIERIANNYLKYSSWYKDDE